ncbi:hypothetical protein MUY27_02600 [Mucilaginibacter sp. RS28]|uniref:DUF2892 domain-containing protein n=1 Tax=Mucilaginibacter straminoryzae TaxID=2932774 RepID=A0A9X1X0W3_9SPHI|nr:hypothetical protein [Mucilaginibacter straminoryzae]MCJ8208581.1 hypothetical protein [Mucilaginibacter straminoryzae]
MIRKYLKKQLLTRWNLARVLRLLISSTVIYLSFEERNWLFFMLGIITLYQALSNTGCTAGACAIPNRTSRKQRL